ncbi:lycopene cyclase domain-containing protein [Arthrobacter rhombi]|uniref:C50 carotenoid epsilon cyclase n=1 Tax=Arthrobacter rhombi TaxID=71253 RepID=A0A1R4EWK4_9MICC|nr:MULTISPECIES: lycopene cyclase domain-containing protein [Micrococcaceae]PCC24272.1 C50 carotenoid epsilon cyclase [Glutamicibacter sp. BW78]SJM48047.1 C50 carotenoid epsilon cyclase [Arthrobacter rhombi]
MTYLVILLFLLGCMTALDARFGLFFWSHPWRSALVLCLGVVYFLSWDLWAITAGIFLHRDSPLMTGIMLADQLPVEEPVFLLFLSYQTMIAFTGSLAWLRHRVRGKAAHRAAVPEGTVSS